MLTLVFKTKGYGKDVDYDRNKGDRNFEDFCDFMQAIGANREGQSNVWNLNFKGQEITFIYADTFFAPARTATCWHSFTTSIN